MNDRILIECCDGGFIVETWVCALTTNKRVHVDAGKAADDVRGRLMARCAPAKEPEKSE